MMRVGMVGVGVAGRSHLFDLATCPGMEPVAVCAASMASAGRAGAQFGIESAYDDLSAMLAEEKLDGLVVAVPPSAGDRLLPLAAASGLPVVIDKPGATSPARLRTALSTDPGFAGRAVVSYNRRYQAHVRTLKSWLAAGELGAVRNVRCIWSGPFRERYSSSGTYRCSAPFGRGVLLDTV
jgi:predicted dehydrogenase